MHNGLKFRDEDGTMRSVSTDHPLPVTGGGGGGGGGDASAANQVTGNTRLQEISTATGTPADAAWASGNGTIISLLKSIRAATGSGGGGGAVTIADGADATFGAMSANAALDLNTTTTFMGYFKGLFAQFGALSGSPATSSTGAFGTGQFIRAIFDRLGDLSTTPASSYGTASNLLAHVKGLRMQATPAASASTSSVTSTTTATTLTSSNVNRRQLVIFNDSTANLFILFAGSGLTTTNFTVKLAAGDTLFLGIGDYTGSVQGMWDVANGAARVTVGVAP